MGCKSLFVSSPSIDFLEQLLLNISAPSLSEIQTIVIMGFEEKLNV